MTWDEKLGKIDAYIPQPADYSVRLDANESFLLTPVDIWAGVAEKLASVNLTRYPDPMATEVCRLAARIYDVKAENVVAGCGSDELIALLLGALVPHGNKLLLCEPDFSMYRFYAGLYDLHCINAPKNGRIIDADMILDEIKRTNPDVVMFSNPCNPMGLGITADKVKRIVEETDALVVVDEAYMDFWTESVTDMVGSIRNLVVLKTCSKAFGLAGIRLGFALCHEEVVAMLKTVKSPFNVNSLTQAIGEVILNEPEYLRNCAKTIIAAKNSLFEELSKWTESNSGFDALDTVTNFVLLCGEKASALHKALLDRSIAVRLVSSDLLRITAGTEAEHKKLLAAMEEIQL